MYKKQYIIDILNPNFKSIIFQLCPQSAGWKGSIRQETGEKRIKDENVRILTEDNLQPQICNA